MLWCVSQTIHSRGPPKVVGVNVPMFPWNKGACSPAPPSKIRYLMFPVPHYYLCSSFSIKSWPYFPRSREINAIFPVPKTPGRALSILNFRFSLNKIRRLQLLYSWSQYCLLQRNTNAVDLMYTQYVNWNKHPVPIPPSSRLLHYELQHSCVTSCRKSWCESCWYSCNCEGPPIKIHFSIDLSNCYSYNHVLMYTCDCQFH